MNVEASLYTPAGKPRARSYGIPFQGQPGRLNSICDVAGVAVGYCTLIAGSDVRTGVTAIVPRAHSPGSRVMAGCSVLNGNGEMSGMAWIQEAGEFEGPITLTNTHACGLARDATIKWMATHHRAAMGNWMLPVATETCDGRLNDLFGFHVREEHVFAALDAAVAGKAIEEGSVGGGTGMVCYGYKGGSGTASRVVHVGDKEYTVGVFLQSNFGKPLELLVAGVPVGQKLGQPNASPAEIGRGSVVAIVATDAPLLPHQLSRMARRAALGIGRSGSIAAHSSGDLFLAFSTANSGALASRTSSGAPETASFVPNSKLDPLFEAVIQAVDEAVLNSMYANEDMVGVGGACIRALPRDRVREIMSERSKL